MTKPQEVAGKCSTRQLSGAKGSFGGFGGFGGSFQGSEYFFTAPNEGTDTRDKMVSEVLEVLEVHSKGVNIFTEGGGKKRGQ